MTLLYDVVVKALKAAVEAVKENDPCKAQDVRAMKEEVKQTVHMALKHQSTRLTIAQAGRLAGFRFEMEALDKLERPYKLTRRIANKVLPTELFLEQAEYIVKCRMGYVE